MIPPDATPKGSLAIAEDTMQRASLGCDNPGGNGDIIALALTSIAHSLWILAEHVTNER